MKKNYTEFKQGIYKPTNIEKYVGRTPINFRSSWELYLMRYLDNNKYCTEWASESTIIPYTNKNDGKVHRYFIDFRAVFIDKEGVKKIFYIEVKPEKQTLEPTRSEKKKMSTYIHEKTTYEKNLCSINKD